MKKNFIASVALLAATAGFTLPAAAAKVGVVNLQRALQESKKGKTAKASLEKEVEEKRKKIESERASIQKASEEFQKKSSVLSEKARTAKGMEIQQKMGAFQDLVQKSQSELQGREAELTKPILDGLRATVPDLAKKKKLDFVFEENTSGLLYSADKEDLTDEVIKLYDEKP